MNERILWDAIEVYLAVYFLIILPAFYCYRTMHNSKVRTRARKEGQQLAHAMKVVKSPASRDALQEYADQYPLIAKAMEEAMAKPIVKPKVVPIHTKDEYARQNRYTRHRVNSWDHGEGDFQE